MRDVGPAHLNQTTTMGYDAVGNATAVTDPNGNITRSTFDALRRPITVTSPATAAAPNGVVTSLSYDPDGRLLASQLSSGGQPLQTTSATYTMTGQRATATDPKGNVTTYSYDVLDRLAGVTDPMGRITTYGYDALSRRTSIANPAVAAGAPPVPGGPLLQQSYTSDGLLASLTDANGNATSFVYDGFDRLASMSYPLGSTESFTYDADGNLLTRLTRAGQTIAFVYDTLNRLCTKTIATAPTACGAATSVPPTVWFTYDLAGRRTGVRDNSAAITPPAAGAAGPFATSTSYDAMNRPTGVSWSPAPAAAPPGAGSVSFGHSYNAANQRIGGTTSDNTWWHYPPATATTVSYTPDALNRYTAVGSVSPTYDGNGNLTFDGTFTYGYDAENRLTSVSQGGNTVASYAYDAPGPAQEQDGGRHDDDLRHRRR